MGGTELVPAYSERSPGRARWRPLVPLSDFPASPYSDLDGHRASVLLQVNSVGARELAG